MKLLIRKSLYPNCSGVSATRMRTSHLKLHISHLPFSVATKSGCELPKDDILDLHVGHVGGEVQKNISSILLWASAVVGELHCSVIPERLVASQEYYENKQNFAFQALLSYV